MYITYSTYQSDAARGNSSYTRRILFILTPFYKLAFALRLHNNLPVANYHPWADMTGFSHTVAIVRVYK